MTIPEIAAREGISQPLAAKTLALLRKFGYVKSTRGQLGGYILTRPADQILIGTLLSDIGGRLVNDEYCDRFSVNDVDCVHRGSCQLLSLYQKMQDAVDRSLRGVTLATLLNPEPVIGRDTIVAGGRRS